MRYEKVIYILAREEHKRNSIINNQRNVTTEYKLMRQIV